MPVQFYLNKSYRQIIQDRLLVIKEEKAKIERTVGAAFLAGQPVDQAKKDYEALTAEAGVLKEIQDAVQRDYGIANYNGDNAQW